MDEQTIPRRDAVLGLGTLIALIGLMVAMIAYRIVIEPANRRDGPRPAPAVSPESLATWRAYQRAQAPTIERARLEEDTAAPEGDVQPASHVSAETMQSPASDSPRFVAPSSPSAIGP